MAQLIHIANVSLDGYIEDEQGSLEWTSTDDDVFVFLTELVRPVGTYLYGRRLYETMAVWETDLALPAQSDLTAEFARVWQSADKVVYSTTLEATSTERTRLERTFDPAAVRALKDSATRDLMIGGADLTAQAIEAGVLDECHLLIRPVVLGGGKPALPRGRRVDLELLDERRVGEAVVYVRCRVHS